jgi:hypothetical protein
MFESVTMKEPGPYYRFVRFRHKLFVLAIVAALAGCGGPADRIKERANALTSPTPTPGERDISGAYEVSGTAGGGLDPYKGTLAIEPQGDLYSFRWTLEKGNRVGTGVQYGNSVAAAFAPTGEGKGCGVGVYKILPDGTLDGRRALFGENKFSIEKATRTEGDTFGAKYSITGTTAEGQPYSGTLETKKDGDGYDFVWRTDKPLAGFGIWRGSAAAVGFGGPQCSFAYYDILSSSSLEGFWGSPKQITFGKETAKR